MIVARHIESLIQGMSESGIICVADLPHTPVIHIVGYKRLSLIRGAVVYYYQFPVCVCLFEQAVYSPAYEP